MSEKRFTMKYSFEDEEYVFCVEGNPLTPSMVLKMLNELQDTIEAKNEYQRTLEAKIRRLKDRIKVLEKNE